MLVSHDRALLRAVCDEFWLVSKGGIAPFDGDLDDYQQFLLDEAKRMKALAQAEQAQLQQKALAVAAKPSPPKTPAQSSHKKQQRLESDMQTLEQEKEQLSQAMSMTTSSTELAKLGSQLKNTEDQLSQLEAQWLDLLEQSEKA
jgi:ATP-binding cassette subfamily F protein 3